MNTKPFIFISYSSHDCAFAEYLYSQLIQYEFTIFKDDYAIRSGTPIGIEVISAIAKTNILIPILSKKSFESKWVHDEITNFTFRMEREENSKLRIIPILIEECVIPKILLEYRYINATSPTKYSNALIELYSAINEVDVYPNNYKRNSFSLREDAELARIKNMIQTAVDSGTLAFRKQLEYLTNAMQKQQYILAPASIAIKEMNAYDQIWVVTNHLFNDVYEPDIKESVTKNFERGIKYKYFVVESPLIIERKEKYEEMHKGKKGKYEFITLQEGMILPFDEIVLYDPLDPSRLWGYAQIKYKIQNSNDDDIFLKLSDIHSGNISNSLKPLAYPKNK